MTDQINPSAVTSSGPTDWKSDAMQARIGRRYRRERIFRSMGLAAVFLSVLFLLFLLGNIVKNGAYGFMQTSVSIDVTFDANLLGEPSQLSSEEFTEKIRKTNMLRLIQASMRDLFPEVKGRRDSRALLRLVSTGARAQLREMVLADPSLVGTTKRVKLLTSDDIDQVIKGNIDITLPEANRKVKDKELSWLKTLQDDDRISLDFHSQFLTGGDSREPELAGVWGAIVGSALTLLVTLLTAFPIGLFAAVYLEEFAPKNRFTDIIEININNLAAVPSIVFGLLGLAVFLSVMGMPRSAPIVGGLTLALLTLPTVIIASRASIAAVPPSIRDAARGLGASPMQVVFHHVIPLAMPGIMTGTIIGMARALGESAPLLMIGMVAFIVDIPGSINDAATVLPVQIYLWADSPERAFVEKTSAAIMVLLFFLIAMNGVAIWLRQKFEQKW